MVIFIRYLFFGFLTLSGLHDTYGITMCISSRALATTSQQYILSPNYPSNYNHNQNCQLTIYSTNGQNVNIRMTSFNLEDKHDTLAITSSSLSRTFTGRKGNTTWGYFRGGSSIRLRFITDGSFADRGFQLVFFTSGARSFPACSGSGSELTATTTPQYFYSPNMPSNYPHNTNCAWKISSADSDYLVTARSETFTTEAGLDTLKIYSGYDENQYYITRLSGSVSTSRAASTNWTARCHEMYLVFNSDGSDSRQGFIIAYWAIPRGHNTYNSGDCKRPISTGVIIGAAVGGVVGFVLLIVLVVCCCKACSNGSSTTTPVRSVPARTTAARSNAVGPAAYPQQPAVQPQAPNGARVYHVRY